MALTRPPNVILIMTDQHRADAVGFAGNPLVNTPNLDALAEGGCVMRRAWTPIPLCMPARSCLMTGRYPGSLGLTDNQMILGPEFETLPGLLRQHGYSLALFGKNHCFTRDALAEWDACEVYGIHGKEADASRSTPTANDLAVTVWRSKTIPYFEAAVHHPQPGLLEDDPAVRQTDEAIGFLSDTSDRPFFMYLSYEAPHFPYVLPEPCFSKTRPEDMPGPGVCVNPDTLTPARLRAQWYGLSLDRATDDDIRRIQATYMGMIELVDTQIGRVIDALRRTGKLDQTLIVFCSDHGDFWGERGLIGKSTVLYESLLRVPLVFHGPGVPRGVASDAAVDLTDLAPTILELLGLAPMSMSQGRSFAGCLRDPGREHRRYIVAEHAFGRASGSTRDEINHAIQDRERFRARHGESWFLDLLRGETWSILDTRSGLKWIGHAADKDELYDLKHDPRESTNLINEPAYTGEADRLRELRRSVDTAHPDVFAILGEESSFGHTRYSDSPAYLADKIQN